jgi:hypothetical protein
MSRNLVATASRFVIGLLAPLLLGWAPFAQAALERWEQLGPFEGYVRGVMPVKINGASTGVDTLYAWTYGGGMVKATWNNAGGGGGGYWNGFVRDSAGLPHGRVISVTREGGALVPGTTVMYAAVEGEGVWQATIPASNTTPLSWTQLTTTNLSCHFVFSVFSPAAGHLVAGTSCSGPSSGVFHYNAGAWNRVGAVPPNAGSIGSTSGIQVYSFMPVVGTACSPNCVYAATSAGVYFTDDYMSGSATWTPLSVQPTGADNQPNVFNIRTHTQSGTLYMAAAVNGGGVQRTSLPNTGSSDFTTVNAWESAPLGNFGLPRVTVAGGLSRDFGNTTGDYWVGIQGSGLFYSSNGVNTGPFQFSFETGTEGIPQPRFAARVIPDPISGASNTSAMIVAATVEGVFYKWPGSPQWNQIWFDDDADASPISGVINGIAIDPQNPSISYVATSGRFHQLLDPRANRGGMVEIAGLGDLGTGGKRRLVLDPTDTGSGDHRNLWLGAVGSVRKIGCDSFGCFDNGLRLGPNYPGGANSLPNLRGAGVSVILDTNAAGPGLPIYVFTDRRYPGESIGRGIWKSVDGGNNWSDFSGSLGTLGGGVGEKHILSATIATDGTLIIATRAGIFKSGTGSASWSAVSTPLPTDANHGSIPADVVADGTNVYVAYYTQNSAGAAGPSTGLYTGTTSACCTKNGSFPAGIKPNAIAVTHPGGNPTAEIWVGATDDATGGLYKSSDGGTTWRTSNVKLNNTEVRTFGIVNSSTGQPVTVAAVGTTGGGISVRAVQNGPDFNNDGYADIGWRKTNGSNGIWMMNGLQVTQVALTNGVATTWTLVGRGDFDGDGHTDLLWRNVSSGANAIWLMEGSSVKSTASLSGVAPAWSVAGVGDMDGNGKSDILWRSNTGSNAIWFMDGTTTANISALNVVGTDWSVLGLGDFNNDGKSDIFWRNTVTGANAIWFMNGSTPTIASTNALAPGTGWVPVGTGDFDGDGFSDVMWQNSGTRDNAIWLMNANAIKSSAVIGRVSDTSWNIANIADFSGDYMSDILWRNSTTGANYTWTMRGLTIQSTCGVMGCQSGYLPAVPDMTWSISNP